MLGISLSFGVSNLHIVFLFSQSCLPNLIDSAKIYVNATTPELLPPHSNIVHENFLLPEKNGYPTIGIDAQHTLMLTVAYASCATIYCYDDVKV